MSIYAELPIVSAIVVYIVDLSGFTDSWRSLLARLFKVRDLRPLPPFDCGQCMSWWCCLLYALIKHEFTLPVVAESAALAFLSVTTCALLLFIRELLLAVIDKLTPNR